MTIVEEEDPRVGDDADDKESAKEVDNTSIELSPPSKPESEMTGNSEGSQTASNYNIELDAPSFHSEQSDQKHVDLDESNNGIETTAVGSSSSSKPKSKGTKKKKKKVSRNKDRDSPESEQPDDKSSNGIETKTVSSTASSKMKSKGTKKKKKKITANDDAESIDVVSLSSNVTGQTTGSMTSPKKKKKKKKVPKDGESDVDPEPESATSLLTSSEKSTSKMRTKSVKSPKSSKSKKKKVKRSSGNKPNIPDLERTKSLDPDRSAKSFESDSGFIVRRSMSMDGSNPHHPPRKSLSLDGNPYHPPPSMAGGRMNGMNGNNWPGRGRAYGGRGRGPPGGGRGRGRGRGPPPGAWAGPRPQRPPEGAPYGMRGVSQERPYGARSPSHERSPYGVRSGSQERSPYGRSPSQERIPYGNPRAANGVAMAPSPRGRRRMSFPPPTADENGQPQPRGNHPMQSGGNMYRAPGRPKSILRNSSHHGMIHGSSHHRSIDHRSIATSSSHSSSQHRRRVVMDLNPGSRSRHSRHGYPHSSFESEIDASDVESDEDDSSFAMEESAKTYSMEDSSKHYQKQVPSTVVRGSPRTLSGLGTNSSHHAHLKSTGQSTRSLLTIERQDYQGENAFIRALRYIHVLAPHPNEDPIKKKIRLVTWVALCMDFFECIR